MSSDLPAEVLASDGSSRSFGSYLRELKTRNSVKITRLVADAGISRANYYLLESDKQRPSLATAVALLAVHEVETRVPSPDDPDLAKDLDMVDDGTLLALRINWSSEERRRSRDRFWTSAGIGLGAATGTRFAPWGAVGAFGLPVAAAGAAAAAALFPGSLPIAGVALAAKLLHERSKQKAGTTPGGETSEAAPGDVMADFAKAAEDMSTEELEALLEAMKAMRAERDSGGRE